MTPEGLDELGRQPRDAVAERADAAALRRCNKLAQTHLSVITKTVDYEGFLSLKRLIEQQVGSEAEDAIPALAALQDGGGRPGAAAGARSRHLVPTLTQSFGLTVGIIFGTFLLVFR